MQKGLIKAKITQKGLYIVPEDIERPDMFYKKILFVRYLADPTNTTGNKGLKKFSELTEVPLPVLKRWRESKQVQGLVAQTARDYALDGDGIALAYKEAHKILLSGGEVDAEKIVEDFLEKCDIEEYREAEGHIDLLLTFTTYLQSRGLFISDLKQKTDIIKTMIKIDDKRTARADKMELEMEKAKARRAPKGEKSYEERIVEAEYSVVEET